MRWIPVVFMATVLAAFAVQAEDPAAVQSGQAASAAAPPSPTAAPEHGATGVTPAVPATPVTAAPESAAAPASAGDAASASASSDATEAQPVVLKMATVPPPANFKPPSGYRAVKRGLDTVYCTSITPIGSRMPQTYCMSREQVEQLQRQAESERQMLREKVHPGGTNGG